MVTLLHRALGGLVSHPSAGAVGLCWLPLAEGTRRYGFEKLDGPTRAAALAALVALVILWVALPLLAWWGARIARRYMRSPEDENRTGYGTPRSADDWARKPLTGRDPSPDEPES